MQVRAAQVDDAPQIAALHVRAWQVAYAGTLPGGYLMGMDIDERTARRREMIARIVPPQAMLVVSDEGGICGFAGIGLYRADPDAGVEPRVGEVYGIYVHPGHWSTGAGLTLMRAAVTHLTGVGFTEIRLWVLDENPRARRFYERFGFTADGTAKMFTVDAGGPHEMQARELRYTLPVR